MKSLTLNPFVISEYKEAHLEVMPKIWEELRSTERDILVQHQVHGKDESETTKLIAERLLETAMEYLQTKEIIEEEHAFAAHKKYQHAVEEEAVLEEFVMDDNLKDIPLDSFVAARLYSAHKTEHDAIQDEEFALHELDELHRKEEVVRATLEELKRLQP